ncbi:hypothetical protein ACHAW5_007312 [Stephanodiscus triporus]|uniref:Translation initiation factor eIF2B subunit alpha n=1 Tax=Stephanodiscus triporus TaxID=2934178 RepID=A0ABD3N926_9STRA
MDQEQRQRPPQRQHRQQQQHPVITDLCFHLTKSSNDDDDAPATAAAHHPPQSSPGGGRRPTRPVPPPGGGGRRSHVPLPVAAIRVLLDVIRRSEAETMMGLQAELRDASDVMVDFARRGGPVVVSNDSDDDDDYDDDDVDGVGLAATKTTTKTTGHILAGRYHIALSSGCELFLKHVTRASLETPDFRECRARVLERGTAFASYSTRARDRIAAVGSPFVREGCAVLTHGRSRVVESILLRAALVENRRFRVYVLEGRPDAGGARSARSYANAGIPTTVVLDSAMGHVMERVDLVLVGAEGVVENGGTVNKVGTFALGVLARELGVPMYVAAESYKFTRLYPLNNADLPEMTVGGPAGSLMFLDTLAWSANATQTTTATTGDDDNNDDDGVGEVVGEKAGGGNGGGGGTKTMTTTKATEIEDYCRGSLRPYVVDLPPSVSIENPPCDFTPAKYITLLFTDMGVLTPSAVSDELIRLYQ